MPRLKIQWAGIIHTPNSFNRRIYFSRTIQLWYLSSLMRKQARKQHFFQDKSILYVKLPTLNLFFLVLFPFWEEFFLPVLVSQQEKDESIQKFAIRTSTAVHYSREIIQMTPSCVPCFAIINLHSHFPWHKDSHIYWSCQSQENQLLSLLWSDCNKTKLQ